MGALATALGESGAMRHTAACQLISTRFGFDCHRNVVHTSAELIGNEIVGVVYQPLELRWPFVVSPSPPRAFRAARVPAAVVPETWIR